MRIDRLYAITVYLLNHGRTSAAQLARHFEVSLRTVQRDIDSLCMAGIPITAINGAAGGYEISERFVMDRGFATSDDYSYILTALQGLVSATEDQKAKNIMEKISHASDPGDSGMILDFSSLREVERELLRALLTAALTPTTIWKHAPIPWSRWPSFTGGMPGIFWLIPGTNRITGLTSWCG